VPRSHTPAWETPAQHNPLNVQVLAAPSRSPTRVTGDE
jgi:hypothetical protein